MLVPQKLNPMSVEVNGLSTEVGYDYMVHVSFS